MSSKIENAFHTAAREGRTAFVPYMTAGFPDPSAFLSLVQVLDKNGADVIEVGLPFSDPMVDGPIIQASSKAALDLGMTPGRCFDLIAEAAETIARPFVVMTYWNPVLAMGPAGFADRARDAGVSGVIIPDLPPEEAGEWSEAAEGRGLDTIFLAARTTPAERRRTIVRASKGFAYYVSVNGVTGSGVRIEGGLIEELNTLRAESPVPVAVGFGISTPAQAGAFAGAADGVIVGSALIREIMEHADQDAAVAAVDRLSAAMIEELNGRKGNDNDPAD